MFFLGRIAGFCVLAAWYSAAASAAPAPKPLNCNAGDYLQGVQPYREKASEADKVCKENENAGCNELPATEVEAGHGKSVCKNIYRKFLETIGKYETMLKDRCESSNALLKGCLAKKEAAQIACLRDHARVLDKDEDELSALWKKTLARLELLEKRAVLARDRYRKQNMIGSSEGPMRDGRPMGWDSINKKCVLGSTTRNPEELFKVDPRNPASEGKIIDEQIAAIKFVSEIKPFAVRAAESHQRRAKEFKDRASEFDNRVKRAQSVDPQDAAGKKNDANKSDITGGDRKQPPPQPSQQQAGGQSGGGGGGGPQGGGAADQGGMGATASTPPSFNNASVAPVTESRTEGAAKVDLGKPYEGSRTGETIGPLPLPDVETVPTTPMGTGSNLASSSSSTQKNSARASSSKSTSAGGAGGMGGSTTAKPCLGTDCQQALGNLKNSQFASVGSLGGGGGLGLDGDIGSLDSLFRADDFSKSDPGGSGSLHGLDSLDAAMDGETIEEETAAGEQSGTSEEIGKSDGRNLFLRVRSFHVRALKRGLLVGVPKKL